MFVKLNKSVRKTTIGFTKKSIRLTMAYLLALIGMTDSAKCMLKTDSKQWTRSNQSI